MILSQGRKILHRRVAAAVVKPSYSRTLYQGHHASPLCSISSSSSSSSSSSPLTFALDDNNNDKRNHPRKITSVVLSPPFEPRYFSSASEKKEEKSETKEDPPVSTSASESASSQQNTETNGKEEESLKDTIRKMRREKGAKGDSNDERVNDLLRQASDFWSTATEEVSKTWGELLRSGDRKDINKKIGHPQDTTEGEEEYTGPVSIMVIDESENLTAWERMQKRLTEAPVIQGKFAVI